VEPPKEHVAFVTHYNGHLNDSSGTFTTGTSVHGYASTGLLSVPDEDITSHHYKIHGRARDICVAISTANKLQGSIATNYDGNEATCPFFYESHLGDVNRRHDAVESGERGKYTRIYHDDDLASPRSLYVIDLIVRGTTCPTTGERTGKLQFLVNNVPQLPPPLPLVEFDIPRQFYIIVIPGREHDHAVVSRYL
jgi:hypothetical protein